MSFSNLGLNDSILKAIDEQGYNTPTPIQQQAIPVILDNQDVLAAAQTGTGKTAGFTLPLLEILSSKATEKRPSIKVLILVPTRELAMQVAENIGAYSKYLPIKSAVIFGGVGFNPQKATLRKGVDIVIATPGRLLDHMNQKTINLSKVDFLVLDEADRMLDMGFIHDIKKVMTSIPKKRQTLLFSATFSKEIIELSKSLLNEPTLIEVAKKNSSSSQIKQVVHYVRKDKKRELLAYLINDGKWEQVLVFTKTKHGANRLAEYLNRGFIKADAIHGNKSQGARTKALANFKMKKTRVLVATDIAARGIDIDNLPFVVNFDLPNIPEDYVHRIGRTGRAGKEGIATSLVCSEESQFLKDIEKLIGKDIEVNDVAEYTISFLGNTKISKKKSLSQKRVKNSDISIDDNVKSKNSDRSKRKSLSTKDKNRNRNNRSNNKEDKENQYFKDAKSKYEGNSDWKKEKSQSSRSNRNRRVTANSRPRKRYSK